MAEQHDDRFIKVRLNSLHANAPIPFDLYVLINNKQIHYLRAGGNLEQEKLSKFESKAPDNFYVKIEDRAAFKTYVHEKINSGQLTSKEKAVILRESSLTLIEELFESEDINRALNESKPIINHLIELMDSEPEAMSHLVGLSSHDFYTYTHSLDVGVYSLGLAKVLGFSKDDLAHMGQGAIFHDVGKRQVSIEIITKIGPLNDVEWAQMQKHPQYGLVILSEHNASDEVKACCFEHHESMAGNGYPQQLQPHEIHPMAKIIALADTFDALTTQRSYNKPMRPAAALDFMKNKLASRYDPEMLRALYEVLFHMQKTTGT
ncbi:MAG: HD family phosphohydrolase [Bdellovibrionales bacterium RBG_16_40_8]|nr:MAG: HD family phosphohydrolase [Bdellovibrionales bacterium RBG_16_40_8]